MATSSSGISDEDEVSNWMEYKDRFPATTTKRYNNVVPSDLSGGKAKCMMPHGVPVSFSKQDKTYESFLAGPALVKEGKVDIEGAYFSWP